MPSTVTVHYSFHPLHNHCLDVVAWPRQTHQAVTVQHTDGQSLKIPLWMLQPDAANIRLSAGKMGRYPFFREKWDATLFSGPQ